MGYLSPVKVNVNYLLPFHVLIGILIIGTRLSDVNNYFPVFTLHALFTCNHSNPYLLLIYS